MDNCGIISESVDNDVARVITAFEIDSHSVLDEFIGSKHEAIAEFSGTGKEGALAIKAHSDMYDSMFNLLLENAASLNYINYNPSITIEPLKDYIQHMFGMYGSKQSILKMGPRRIIAANKEIKRLISLWKSRGGKSLNLAERQILPPVAFALRNDKFGYIYKYFKKVVTMTEEYHRRVSKFRARHNKTMSKLMSMIDATLAKQDIFTKEWVPIGGGANGIEVTGRDGKHLLFHGSYRDKSGNILHDVIDRETGEEKSVSENEISRSNIITSLLNYYTYELTNDLLDGQMRHIIWDDTPDDNAMVEILSVYHKINVKNNLEDRDLSKLELSKGMSDIYEISYRGDIYQYVMVKRKNIETGLGEEYHAYVTRIKHSDGSIENTYDKKNKKIKKVDISFLKNGFYRSNEYKVYGKAINKYDKLANYDEHGWANFEYMKQQPHSLIMFNPGVVPPTKIEVVGEHRIAYNTIWSSIYETRSLYNDVFDNASILIEEENLLLDKWFANDENGYNNIQKMLAKAFNKDADKIYNDIITSLSTIANLHIDNEGSIHTPVSMFKKKQDNYSPRLYEFSVINNDIVDAMESIKNRIEDLKDEPGVVAEVRIEEAKNSLHDLTVTLAFINDNKDLINEALYGNTKNINLLRKNAYTKHRSLWTNPSHRRKDPLAFNDYLDNLFYNIERMSLLSSLLDTISNISSAKPTGLKEIIDALINRTKIGLFDPTAKAGIGNIDYSPQKIADILNSLPGTGRTWDAKSAMDLITVTKGLISAALLGSSSALTNRTQITNEFIRFGWDAISRSANILDDKDEREPKAKWDAIIEHAGTDELTNIFNDLMAQGGDIKFADAAILKIPGVPFQIPRRAIFDIFSMLSKGRKSFVEEKIPYIDENIRMAEMSRIKNINDRSRAIKMKMDAIQKGLASAADKRKFNKFLELLNREYNRLQSQKEKRNIDALREAFFDLILTPKNDNNYSNLKNRFIKLMGDIGDNRLKRAISWKMSWWFPGFGKELFTFTDSERYMRKQSVIINLLTADSAGILGSSQELSDIKYTYINPVSGEKKIASIPERFLSDTAVNIARNGVSNTMFGMSMVNLGEAFFGGGAQLFLYKAYPLQQMLHDYKILRSFMSGNINKYDSITRIRDAFKYLSTKEPYDPTDKKLDHDAIAAARFIVSRCAMSAVSILIESMGILRRFINTPFTEGIFGMVRGGENPAIGISMRLLFKLAIFSMLSPDDDSDDIAMDIGWQMAFLLFPVFFTLPLSIVYSWTS